MIYTSYIFSVNVFLFDIIYYLYLKQNKITKFVKIVNYNLCLVLISGSFHLYTGFLIDVFILVLRIIDRFVKVLSPSNTNICFTQTWFGD